MANAQFMAPGTYGFRPVNPAATTSTFQLSTANNWLGFSFFAIGSRTVNTVRAFISAVAGTLANTDITCEIQTDSSGLPSGANPSGGAAQSLASAITTSGWQTWSGFTAALTDGQLYWMVFKNVNALPGTNNVTFRWGAAGSAPSSAAGWNSGNTMKYGWFKSSTTTGGGGWGTLAAGVAMPRAGYADGSFAGLAASNVASSADLVFSARLAGVKFVVPPNTRWNVAGVNLFIAGNTGTPTGNPLVKAFKGTSTSPTLDPNGTSTIIPKANVTVAGWYPFYFPANVSMLAGDTWRVVLGEDANADTSSNAYKMSEYTMDSDSNSLAILPFAGTLGKTYSTDGTNFTDTATSIYGVDLLLDSNGEFGATGGGYTGIVYGAVPGGLVEY